MGSYNNYPSSLSNHDHLYSYVSSSSDFKQEMKFNRQQQPVPAPSFYSSLHSVRKPLPKPWKKPIAPNFPPTQPKVYKVKTIDFKELVQKLTGAPKFQSQSLHGSDHHHLQDVGQPQAAINGGRRGAVHLEVPQRENVVVNVPSTSYNSSSSIKRSITDVPSTEAESQMGFAAMTPSSFHAWCSSLLLSPTTPSSSAFEKSSIGSLGL